MSVQSLNSSTNSLYAQLMQAESSNLFGSSSGQSLPQLSSDQLQQLQQALQQDLQQAFSGQSSGSSSSGANASGASANGSSSSVQSQLDQSVSNTLGQFGFTNSQTQSVIDKLNQALSGPQGASGHAWHGHGHGRHRVQQTVNSLLQALENNSSSQNSSTSGGSSSSDLSSSSLNGITAVPLSNSSSGQSLDLTA